MGKSLRMVVVFTAALVLMLQTFILPASSSVAADRGVHICDCGKDCKCGTVANKQGKCVCGVEMKRTGEYDCNCGKDCKCGTVANKQGKCVCGVEMQKAK